MNIGIVKYGLIVTLIRRIIIVCRVSHFAFDKRIKKTSHPCKNDETKCCEVELHFELYSSKTLSNLDVKCHICLQK